MGGAVATVRSDGSFVIQNVADGSYRVGVYGMSEDFFLKSGRAGDEDLLDAGLTISRGQSPGSLELVVSSAAGRVDGVVFGEQKQPFSGASVVLVPDPPYRSRTELYKTTTTDQTGGFTLRGIAQGEYKLFAWEEIESGAYQDPDFLRTYEARGEALKVGEGGHYSPQLQLIPASEPRP